MSAVGIHARDEWEALRDAIAASGMLGLGLELSLSGWVERDLKDQIEADLAAAGLRGIVTMCRMVMGS